MNAVPARRYAVFCSMALGLVFIFFSCLKGSIKKADVPSRKAGAMYAFSHSTHEKIFAKEQIECSNCHLMQVKLSGKSADDDKKALAVLMMPGKNECHACHQNDSYTVASQDCIKCHKDAGSIQPDNHRGDWRTRHRYISRVENRECSKCHKQDFCSDCHFKKDDVRQRMHDRNFIFAHSVEARGNPHTCTSCHTMTFCRNCHAERGVTK